MFQQNSWRESHNSIFSCVTHIQAQYISETSQKFLWAVKGKVGGSYSFTNDRQNVGLNSVNLNYWPKENDSCQRNNGEGETNWMAKCNWSFNMINDLV